MRCQEAGSVRSCDLRTAACVLQAGPALQANDDIQATHSLR